MATDSGAIGASRPRRARTGQKRAAPATIPIGHPSRLLTIAVGGLVFLGLMMIFSASFVSSFARYGSFFLFFKKQLLWAVIGVVAFIAFSRLDYRRLRGAGHLAVAGSIFLLIVVLIPGIGSTVGGSSRWIALGPLSFQPSEFAKLAMILFAADVMSRKPERAFADVRHVMLPMIPMVGTLGALIMLQPDMGTTLLIGMTAMGMLFVAGAHLRYLIPIGLVGGLGATALAFGEAYRRARLTAFLDPWADPFNSGYQTIQGLIAIGSGGWFGVGLGASRQKWSYIPNAHTDYIFAIIGEELGLVGTLAVLGMFAFLAYLGVRIARQAPDRFGMLLASGITIWIAVQALVNVGAVTAALPITGVPLPFVSFGGSALLTSLIAMGILRSIAVRARR